MEEVYKLQDADFIKEVYYGDGRESQREVENVCRLYEPEQGMPQG